MTAETPSRQRPPARLVEAFGAQVDRTPEAIAVSHGAARLSYLELERRSNQLAHRLRNLGVGADVLVAIAVPRSLDMAVAVLATLKAGGAYVPLDAAYPQQRLEFMLSDTRAPVLLTTSALRASLPSGDAEVLCLDEIAESLASEPTERLAESSTPSDLAYVIYTSGSTGNPKGVAMSRGPLEALVEWQLRVSSVGAGARTLQFAPLSFDVHFQEMFATWLAGGELVLVDDDQRLDAGRLLHLLDELSVARLFLPFIALQSLADVAVLHGIYPRGLVEVITAGEQLVVTQSLVRFFEQLPSCTLHNHYGPSETHVATAYTLVGAPSEWPRLPPIGTPIDRATIHVLDEAMQPVAPGSEGELYLGGACVARGYLNRPELTAEKFLTDPFSEEPGARLYRTGDLARIREDGVCEFLGRLDGQVKVRGYRIELGEIEVALDSHPAVKQAVAVAREDEPGDKRLVAYVIQSEPVENLAGELRRHLAGLVPEYMIPSAFVPLEEFPRTPSGKIDRRSLPRPEGKRPDVTASYVAPRSDLEQTICSLWARLIKIDRVGVHDDFFELGGNSLLALRTVAHLREEKMLVLPVAQLFAHPTAAQLAAYLEGGHVDTGELVTRRARGGADASEPVAVVGIAGRFPGALDKDALWAVLRDGLDTTTLLEPEEVDASVERSVREDPAYVRRRGILEDADKFDAAFFGITPREAELMDPQQRLLLETSWAALEDAGYVPEALECPVGVFAGVHNNSYFVTRVLARPDAVESLGPFTAMVGNEKDYTATRVAHKLNLTGPALSIHTACSTSLVAIATAVQSLRNGDCDVALAGGASLTVPQASGHLYQQGGMLSDDGHTRPFDAKARGTTFSDGVAMVALRRLSDALEAGDHVYAVIRSAALNNDGADKMSFTAPSVAGQAAVIATAHALAEIDPRSISYVEAHGTATPLGDPIEVQALTTAFRRGTDDKGFCGIGSAKSNFGHLTAAAGVTGLVKVALALENELIPGTVHFESPNPEIDFESSPFYVVREALPWPRRQEAPRRAGVSSFGVGGTNAHVILEEAPERAPGSPSRPEQLLMLSARTADALERATHRLRDHLRSHPELDLADVAYTLHTGRRSFAHRKFVLARSTAEAVERLEQAGPLHGGAAVTKRKSPSVAFLFPGQGSQYVGMGAALYRDEPLFKLTVDRCAELLLPELGVDLREVLYPAEGASEAAAERLKQTELTQSALFTVEYALACLWMSWGVQPRLMIGHSVGEFVCAVLASVMRLEDALRLVAARGKLMQGMPPGTMLSVRLAASEVAPRLPEDVAIAASNGPKLCVVAGPSEAVARLAGELEAEGVVTRALHTSHAFHSPMMEPAVEPFAALVRDVELSAPKLPFISTLTGEPVTEELVTDPMYWARHLRETVRFAEAVAEAWRGDDHVLLEVGPRSVLATLARQQVTDKARQVVVSSLGDTAADDAEWTALLGAVGKLWLAGVAVDTGQFFQFETRRRVPLPTYPFERQRHWLELPDAARAPTPPQRVAALGAGPTAPMAVNGSTTSLAGRQPQGAEPQVLRGRTVSEAPMGNGGAPRALPAERVETVTSKEQHQVNIVQKLTGLVEAASGIEIAGEDLNASFLELGLDSLLLTQVAMSLKRQFGVEIGFRQLLEDLYSLERLAAHLAEVVPPEERPVAAPAAAAPVAAQGAPQASAAAAPAPVDAGVAAAAQWSAALPLAPGAEPNASVQAVVEAQLRLMQQQLALLGGAPLPVNAAPARAEAPLEAPASPVAPAEAAASPAPTTNGHAAPAERSSPYLEGDEPAGPVRYDVKKAFGAIARIQVDDAGDLPPRQRAALDALTTSYTHRTRGSKAWTQEHRKELADPRVVTGFRPPIKELVYPIVAVRSSGSRIWDIDGNEYVDALNGFGSNFLGHAPPLIQEVLREQLEAGYEIGPMQPSVGECAKLVCELTGLDRAAFCNTGSEAVMGAMRIARTVTGRNLIVVFSGSYHGIFDEVIVRGTKRLRSIPAAPGILPESVQNVLVLDYGTPESMAIIKERASELAAVMVEPVQSRRPDFRPVEFLRELRDVTTQAGCAYIWDEVITGFRAHPGGAQALFGVQADLATYGKVAGGGMPLGVIAGKQPWMDALDGGHWQFGDDSRPTAGVTYFAGTFVRHPLTMAATKATLQYLKAQGPALQERINAQTERLATTLNAFFEQVGAPVKIKHFSSLWKATQLEDHPMQDLLFCYLRENGVHIWDGFPCFLTEAHTDADVDFLIDAFKRSVRAMQEAGFYPAAPGKETSVQDALRPPVPGARLGRDPDGNPAWYVPNPAERGKFMKVEH